LILVMQLAGRSIVLSTRLLDLLVAITERMLWSTMLHG
jgi:hypothetical protein